MMHILITQTHPDAESLVLKLRDNIDKPGAVIPLTPGEMDCYKQGINLIGPQLRDLPTVNVHFELGQEYIVFVDPTRVNMHDTMGAVNHLISKGYKIQLVRMEIK